MIQYSLEVTSGPNTGEKIALDTLEPFTFGSAPEANWVVPDPAAKPNHARLTMEQGSFWLENLSSSGTLVDGALVMERVPFAVGSTVTFGKTVLRLRSSAEKQSTSLVLPLVALIVLLAGAAAVVIPALENQTIVRKLARAITRDDWHNIYEALDTQLALWDQRGCLPYNFHRYFRRAWFRDCSGDNKTALRMWQELQMQMATRQFPRLTPKGKTVGMVCSDDDENLYAIMRHPDGRVNDNSLVTSNDQYFLKILWWFVNLRIKELASENP